MLLENGHAPETNEGLTVFGATVISLCVERGVRSRQALVVRLREAGYVKEDGETPLYSHARVGNWYYGRNAVDRKFCAALVDVLGLEDTSRLAEAFTFGQDEKAGDMLKVS